MALKSRSGGISEDIPPPLEEEEGVGLLTGQ